MSTQDPYKILGVSRGASKDDVRKAYRKLVRAHHPDANLNDPAAEERFKEIQQAYETLSNPRNRRDHDQRAYTHPGSSVGRPRTGAGRGHGGRTTFSGDISDLLSKLVDLSNDRVRGRKEGSWELGGEDVARVARLLGVDISRISKLLGENIKARANVSFGDNRAGSPSVAGDLSSAKPPKGATGGVGKKPPKPRKPPKPPKSR